MPKAFPFQRTGGGVAGIYRQLQLSLHFPMRIFSVIANAPIRHWEKQADFSWFLNIYPRITYAENKPKMDLITMIINYIEICK